MIRAIGNIISNCTFGKIDKDALTSFDLEYIFLKLRAKSVSELVELTLKCEKCGKDVPIEISLDDIDIDMGKPLPKKIMLTDEIGIVPRYITTQQTQDLAEIKDKGEMIAAMIEASIESIFDKERVYPTAEADEGELTTFIDSLGRDQMAKIEEVIADQPEVHYLVEAKCPHCKTKVEEDIRGISSFF
jgi:phage FluMu protein Com